MRTHGTHSCYVNGCRCDDCSAVKSAYNRDYHARNREHTRQKRQDCYETEGRDGHYRRRYGISLEQFDEMAARQEGRCASCGETPSRLHVDHNHETREVRGLLCNGCNRGLGFFDDDPYRLRAAADYLDGARWTSF